MRKLLFLTGLFLFMLPLFAWAADLSGNWDLTMTGPQGEETWNLVITAEGNSLKITGKHPFLGDVKGTGKLDGDKITMKIYSTGQMVVNFDFKGDVKDNKMSGTREIEMDSGAPSGGAPSGGGEGKAPAGAPPGGGGMPDLSSLPKAWSAEKK